MMKRPETSLPKNWQARLVKARFGNRGRYDRRAQTEYKAGEALYKLRTGELYHDSEKRQRLKRKRRYNRRKEVDCQARGKWFLLRASKTGKLDERLLFQNYTMWSEVV